MTNPLAVLLATAATAAVLAGCSSGSTAPEVADVDFGPVTFCDLIQGGPEIDEWTEGMQDEMAAPGNAAIEDADAATALDLAKTFAERVRAERPAFEAFFDAVADTVDDPNVADELGNLSVEFMGPLNAFAAAAESSSSVEAFAAALEATDSSAWEGKTNFELLGDYEEATCS